MKKNSQLKIGAVLSYIQMGLGVVIGLVYTPLMTNMLGQSEYGLYNTVSSTISMLSVLNLGFNSSYIRYYAKYKEENDDNSIHKLNGMFFLIFCVIGVVAFICGVFMAMHLEFVFAEGLTRKEYSIAKILMLLLTINLTVSFPMSVFSNIISANERFIFLKLLGMLKTVGGPLITLPLLLIGFRSIAMVSVSVGISFITDLLYIFYVIYILKNKFIFHNFEKGLFSSLFVYTSLIAINLIVDQINWNIDKILLGRFKGTATVAIYSVGFSLYQYYQMFSNSISSVFTPRIHKIVNGTKENLTVQKKQLTELFTKIGRIQFLILGLIASGLLFFGKDFIIHIWVGVDYEESYYVMLLLVLPASIALIQNLGIEIQRAENRHQFRSIAYLIMAIINLVMSLYLCQVYGAIGSAIGTAVSLIAANGFAMNIYYHKKCNIDIIYFWKGILGLSRGLLIPIMLGLFMNYYSGIYSTPKYFAQIVAYIIAYCASMWFVGMNDFEKSIILAPIIKR
ncbi:MULTISPECIES: lipopolysaccharide biosynthesis protein [unclassified Lacrimispora]|uniref:lipopolysaccharide biosynthesis protein n=1 Tax=unclassified Lacrimispora TaxID=2719232 RepID=UPI00376FBDB2